LESLSSNESISTTAENTQANQIVANLEEIEAEKKEEEKIKETSEKDVHGPQTDSKINKIDDTQAIKKPESEEKKEDIKKNPKHQQPKRRMNLVRKSPKRIIISQRQILLRLIWIITYLKL